MNSNQWQLIKKSLSISIGKSLILIEVTTFFLYRFLSMDVRNQYSSMTDIDYYWLITIIDLSINCVWGTRGKKNVVTSSFS